VPWLTDSGGPFCLWAAGGEQWSPNLVSALVRALEEEPDAVLAFPACCVVSDRRETVIDGSRLADLAGPMPLVQRANRVIWFEEGLLKKNLAQSLIRKDALRRLKKNFRPELDGHRVWGADQLLPLALALEGYFVYVPEVHRDQVYSPAQRDDADDLLAQFRDMRGYFARCRRLIEDSSLDPLSRDALQGSLAARETTWYCRVLNAKDIEELRGKLSRVIEHCDELRGRPDNATGLGSSTAGGQVAGAECRTSAPLADAGRCNVRCESGLASIVILNYNGREHLPPCLESIQRYTDSPYETIVFDNASTDGSRDYLRTVPNITLVESPVNLGCPPGRAQAIALARGEFVVFLDNDTVVTPGWLSTFLGHARRHPEIGLLGPRSNYVSGAQLVPTASYSNSFEMVQFAKWWCWTARRQPALIPTHRLVGFCMFVRRAVIERIGGPDPQFGKFGFEDDDYTLRALVAGFKAMIANDVYIHHTGGPQATGDPEYNLRLLQAWTVFKRKWGIPRELECGQAYDVASICARPFDRHQHYVPIPPASAIAPMVYASVADECPTLGTELSNRYGVVCVR
jgi:GT2 family glycosyltransferase